MTESREASRVSAVGALVLRVEEQECSVLLDGAVVRAAFGPAMPSPRAERISPGHLLAFATSSSGRPVAVWRWYDAVVVAASAGAARIWEPAHGEVDARPRPGCSRLAVGSRAWASSGLPGADWWIAGPTSDGPWIRPDEREGVATLYDAAGLWEETLSI